MEHIRPTITGSIVWKIPELCATNVTHLCNGYIRINVEDAYHLPTPKDIINLCINYFNTDINILDQLKKGGTINLCSNIFHLDAIKFMMSFRTDSDIAGANPSTPNSSLLWKIDVPYFPENVYKIELDAHMQIIGTNIEHTEHFITATRSTAFVCSKPSFASTIKHLNELQLQLKIFDLKQYDENNNIIRPSKPYTIMRNKTYQTSGFVWRITDQISMQQLQNPFPGVSITSQLFFCESFKWMCKISYYDMIDADLCIYLAALSPKINKLCIYYKIFFEELNKFTDGTQIFGSDENDRMSLWKIDFFKNIEIKELKKITIKVEISIMDIFYSNDYKSISNKNNYNIHKYHTELNTINGKYEWKIDNKNIINNMKTADNGIDFISPFFEINAFKWCVKAYTNGYSNDNIGKMNTFIRLASLPPNIGTLCVHYEIEFVETNTKFAAIERFSSDSPSYGWTANLLKTESIQNCQTFTFKVKIKIIEIFDNDGNIVKINEKINENNRDIFPNMSVCKYYVSTPYLYEWNINDINVIREIKAAVNGKNFLSPIFQLWGLKWYLEYMPLPCDHDPEYDDNNIKNDYSVLYLCAASVSPMIKIIRINYCLMLKETNTIYKNVTELDGCFSTGWSRNTLKRKEIDNINTFTFIIGINFIDIYDKYNNNVTDELIEENKCKCVENDIQLPMLLTDKFEWVINDLNLMKQLKCAVNGQYFMSDMFIMHGFKWKMKVYPNGTKIQRKGIFNWYFNLISLPPNISKVSLFYKIIETTSGAMDLDKTSMRCDSSQFGWGQNKLKLNEIIKFNKMCFVLELKIIDIFDINGKKLNVKQYDKIPLQLNKNDENEWKLNEMKWNITDGNVIENIRKATIGQRFESKCYEMDGFKWFFRLIPNGINKHEKGETKVYICIKSLPINVNSISFYFEIAILENSLLYSNYAHFRDDILCKSWLTKQMKINQLENIKQLTLIAKIKIIDIYYK